MSKYRYISLVICIIFTLEGCSIFFYGTGGIYMVNKMIYPSPESVHPMTYDRIDTEIHEEKIAVYGHEESEIILKTNDPHDYVTDLDVDKRFKTRIKHMKEVCHKHNLDGSFHRRKTDQFMINRKFGLIWCNIFKAASSSWLWNFNLLAGYSEKELLARIHDPLGMARKKYSRPFPSLLDSAQSKIPPPISFLIVRHPFTRLISGFRDKVLKGHKYYRPMVELIMRAHPELQEEHPEDWHEHLPVKSMDMPTFPQFVMYIIDQTNRGKTLNEHWVPMNDFCTPCRNHFDLIAKVETLDEDGNYIIHESGVQDIVKPKVLNRAAGDSSAFLNDYYICQLNERQLNGLIKIYKYDIELFNYEVDRYLDCVKNRKKIPYPTKKD